jgi:hypothetical protein
MIRRTVRRARRRAAGFSLTEVVISSMLLLVMAVSVLPVFTKAAAGNELGRQYTDLSNLARSRAEELMQLPFDAKALTITSGTELVADEQYSAISKKWIAGTALADGDRALWVRRTTIRQYGITNLDALDTPLAAGTPAEGVHVKEILVEVRGAATGSLLGSSKSLTVRILKSL